MIYSEPTPGKAYIYSMPDSTVLLNNNHSRVLKGIERVVSLGMDEAGKYLFERPNKEILSLNSLRNIFMATANGTQSKRHKTYKNY